MRVRAGLSDDLLAGHQTWDRTIPSFDKSYGNEKLTKPHQYKYESWTTQNGTTHTGPNYYDSRTFPNQTNKSSWKKPANGLRVVSPPVFKPMVKANFNNMNTVYKRQFGNV